MGNSVSRDWSPKHLESGADGHPAQALKTKLFGA